MTPTHGEGPEAVGRSRALLNVQLGGNEQRKTNPPLPVTQPPIASAKARAIAATIEQFRMAALRCEIEATCRAPRDAARLLHVAAALSRRADAAAGLLSGGAR
jgi:hypothetical protein